MIKIEIIDKHKSIEPCYFELPDFTVLTGLNGSGKTHLLEVISNIQNGNVYKNKNILKNIAYIPFNGLNPKVTESCDPKQITNATKAFHANLVKVIGRLPTYPAPTIDRIIQLSTEPSFKKMAPKILPLIAKPYHNISEDDILDNFDISMMGTVDFFTGQFALIFKNYHKLQEENNYNRFYKEKGHENVADILSDDEFNEKYGMPPWDFVNKILSDINVPYRVNSPLGSRIDSSFILKFTDALTEIEVTSQDLSTGEKVLMSLALAIYNTKGNNTKPDYLLIDEPDAALHPSMSKKMVEVLKKNIVEASGIPVLITSHSPTTIICSEGISIYQMERGNSIPKKISVQKAVEILSSDIPFLRISNDKRRQVFVESKYDVTYYEQLTNILARIDTVPSEPIYIPARTSNGSNCTDVIDVVDNLFKNGNDQIYGIIDWDTYNVNKDKIIVLGDNERYAIENYLLDPLLMGILFIRENKIPIIEFGLTNISSYSQMINLDAQDAQKIIDKVLTALGLISSNINSYELHNGWKLSLTNEFNLHQGHNLETLYKTKYPFLNSYRREDELKKDIIQKIINDFPEFTPSSIFNTIKKIV